ncbi:phage tail protein [Flavobacterium sp. N1736]|uniref:phage tail protein n=1 Tax=Flavobacterium sp. N1736 TaxID=2986823 RepID=UPI002224A4CA|nr:tail fiber protein [Flavobacterium sp. N1736]
MDGTVGEIRLFAANFVPRNWAFCNGTLIQIRSNTALYSILGTVYGGDGTNTFGLPDLRGRVVVGAGQSAGLSFYGLGQMGGTNSVTLLETNLPPHTHISSGSVSIPAYSDGGNANTPSGNILASVSAMYSDQGGDSKMKPTTYPVAVSFTGNGNPLPLNQPSLGMNYIVCMFGEFPQRP